MSVKLTQQEEKIVNYLAGKAETSWEELAQFSKIPTTVKKKTVQKTLSDLRKKFVVAGLQVPFNCKIADLPRVIPTPNVQIRKTLGGKLVKSSDTRPDLHIDFQLRKTSDADGVTIYQVHCKQGWVRVSESSYELLELFYNNPGDLFSKEDIKNKIWYQWGSRTPASWWGNLSNRMTDLRTSIPEFKTRLMTVKVGNETHYMMK